MSFNKSDVIREYLDAFPDIKNLTLAKLIMKDSPELFKDVEGCRSLVRRVRGAHGERDRGHIKPKDTKYFRSLGKAGETFFNLPQPKESLKDWGILKITGDYKVLILADIHIPYYNATALRVAVAHGVEYDVNFILLNGDIFDFFSISRWEKDPRKRDFPEELNACKQFLMWLREQFPKARIIFKIGNHEERYERYLIQKAPELLGVPSFELSSMMEFDNLGIELVKDMIPIRLNSLYVIHGHEYKSSISNPVNPARGLFLRAKTSTLCSHFHQSSSQTEKDIGDKVVSCWSTGCLSELHPEYMPLNKWNYGFATIETYGDKDFEVQNYKIIEERIYPA